MLKMKGTDTFLDQSIRYARRITDRKLLVRMDAGNDSLDNLHVCHRHPGTDYIIKVNLRKTPKEMWLTIAETKGIACRQREGKTEYVGAIEFKEKGFDGKLRQVFHVIQRTMDRGRPTAAHPRDRGSCVLDLATLRAMARDRTVS